MVELWRRQPARELSEFLNQLASALASRLGDLLVAFIERIAADSPTRRLCVGGSLFYHSDFNSRVKKSKFGTMPKFAKAESGWLALQGDHGEVSFRDIKIRPIEAKK